MDTSDRASARCRSWSFLRHVVKRIVTNARAKRSGTHQLPFRNVRLYHLSIDASRKSSSRAELDRQHAAAHSATRALDTIMTMLKHALFAALVLLAATADAGLTYPKCATNGVGCCAFGSGLMKSPGYAVVRVEVDTIITCSKGELKCFKGNPNLRATQEGREQITCPGASMRRSLFSLAYSGRMLMTSWLVRLCDEQTLRRWRSRAPRSSTSTASKRARA